MDTKLKNIDKVILSRLFLIVSVICIVITLIFISNLNFKINVFEKYNIAVMDEIVDSTKYSDEINFIDEMTTYTINELISDGKVKFNENGNLSVDNQMLISTTIYESLKTNKEYPNIAKDYTVDIYIADAVIPINPVSNQRGELIYNVDYKYLDNEMYIHVNHFLIGDSLNNYEEIYKAYLQDYLKPIKPVTIILVLSLILLISYLLFGIILADTNSIKLNIFEKIYFEIQTILLIILILSSILLAIVTNTINNLDASYSNVALFWIFIIICYVYYYISSNVKRIRLGKFLRYSLILHITYTIFKTITNYLDNLSEQKRFLVLTGLVILQFIVFSLIIMASHSLLVLGIEILFLITSLILLLYRGSRLASAIEKVSLLESIDASKYNNIFPHSNSVQQLLDIESSIEKTVEEQITSERTKTELITNMSHDLRTPLTSIISYIELLKQNTDRNEDEIEYIEIIDTKANRLSTMIDSLFDISKISSGETKLSQDVVDFNKLIEQTICDMDNSTENIVFKSETDLNVCINGNTMYEVLQNILTNAGKYHLEGTRIFVSTYAKNNQAVCEVMNVSSYPMNFTSEDIINRFHRGEVSRTSEGNGLGLSIAKTYTEANNGVFELVLDGDVFKAILKFDIVN